MPRCLLPEADGEGSRKQHHPSSRKGKETRGFRNRLRSPRSEYLPVKSQCRLGSEEVHVSKVLTGRHATLKPLQDPIPQRNSAGTLWKGPYQRRIQRIDLQKGDKNGRIEHKHRCFSQLKTAHFRCNLLFVLEFLTFSGFPTLDFHKLFHRSCEFLKGAYFVPLAN